MKRWSRVELLATASRAHAKSQKYVKRETAKKKRKVRWNEVKITLSPRFNFSADYGPTIDSLRVLKDQTLPTGSNGKRRFFIDLSTVKRISVAGALVLAAEIDRWRRLRRNRLSPRDTTNWDPEVKRRLFSLGFFDLLNVDLKNPDIDAEEVSEVVILPMVTDNRVDGQKLYEIGEYLAAIGNIFEQDPTVYPALTEAAYNSFLHAYPEDHEYEYPPLRKRWWATACWYPKEAVVRFFVYDQGVGIPATLPRSHLWENIRQHLAKLPMIGSLTDDASRLIEAAIDVSRTSLKGGHGKGLSDVVAPILGNQSARVRILSGKGSLICYGDGDVERRDESLHVGGTLIEWTIPAVAGHQE